MDPPKIRFPNKNEIMMMLNDAQKSVDNDDSKSFKSLFVTNKFYGSKNFMVSDAVIKLAKAWFNSEKDYWKPHLLRPSRNQWKW